LGAKLSSIQGDWIYDYLKYTEAQEAPEIFHLWSAVAILASVLNRRVWLPRIAPTGVTYYSNFPGQLSPILIAGAGKAKKSTAINIAKQFMKAAGVKVFDGKITPERLLGKLSQLKPQAVMTTVASELSAFLGKQSYNDGMIDILIKLADCEAHPYETQKGVCDLSDANVCFTLFGGSTPMGLSKAIPPQAQEHGWLSRYCWVYSDKSGKIEPLANDSENIDPQIALESSDAKTNLIVRLRAATTLNGPFKWGKSRTWFIKRYDDYSHSPASSGEGWPARRIDHLVRLAMILNVSRGDRSLVLSQQDLELAEIFISDIEKNMQKCFIFIGQHVNAEQQEKLLKVLRENVLTDSQFIFNRCLRYFSSGNELKATLASMEDAGIIGHVIGMDGKQKFTVLKEPY
jgi:hypothetical protein